MSGSGSCVPLAVSSILPDCCERLQDAVSAFPAFTYATDTCLRHLIVTLEASLPSQAHGNSGGRTATPTTLSFRDSEVVCCTHLMAIPYQKLPLLSRKKSCELRFTKKNGVPQLTSGKSLPSVLNDTPYKRAISQLTTGKSLPSVLNDILLYAVIINNQPKMSRGAETTLRYFSLRKGKLFPSAFSGVP